MKTDNTSADMTTAVVVSPATEKVLVASIVTPARNSEGSATTSNSSNSSNSNSNSEQEELRPSQTPKNDSICSSDMNTNANADIISQYHRKYSNPKALFDEYGDYMDYADPANSLLVDDHHNDYTKNYVDMNSMNSSRGKLNDQTNKLVRKSKNRKSNKSSSMFCVNPTLEPEERAENWFSGSPVSTAAWCGGYSSLLTYYNNEEKQQSPQLQQYPDYYAEFKPQRQYAFDEEDGDAQSTLTPTRALMDGISSAAETGTANDTDSLLTSQSSVQSFMVINRPYTLHNSSSTLTTPLTQKLQKQGSRRVTPEHDHHLHKLIASPSIPGSVDSNCENNNHTALDYALTQSLMRKLQKRLPYGKKGDSFWLQYSLIRDGASLDSLLDMVYSDKKNTSSHICSVLAIETVEGEVFGAYLTQTWRRSYNQWYGGGQSFLWTTALEKNEKSNKNKLRVFPYSFENSYVQLCDRDRLLVGGGDGGSNYERHSYGFGLALEKDLLSGSSCPCTTFESPSLSKFHSDGSTFEIRNLEVWTLTPCLSVIENPSEGLVRVHKREADKKHQQEKEKLRAAQKKEQVPRLLTIPSEETKDEQDDDSFEGFYSCAHPDCQFETDDLEDARDLAAHTFPTAHETTKPRKNRYVFLSPSM